MFRSVRRHRVKTDSFTGRDPLDHIFIYYIYFLFIKYYIYLFIVYLFVGMTVCTAQEL